MPIPQQGNQLWGCYLIADRQRDLNLHIQQEYKRLSQQLHRSPQPEHIFEGKKAKNKEIARES
jgi:hypothetical protein